MRWVSLLIVFVWAGHSGAALACAMACAPADLRSPTVGLVSSRADTDSHHHHAMSDQAAASVSRQDAPRETGVFEATPRHTCGSSELPARLDGAASPRAGSWLDVRVPPSERAIERAARARVLVQRWPADGAILPPGPSLAARILRI